MSFYFHSHCVCVYHQFLDLYITAHLWPTPVFWPILNHYLVLSQQCEEALRSFSNPQFQQSIPELCVPSYRKHKSLYHNIKELWDWNIVLTFWREGWRDCSVVKGIGYSFRSPEFNSQHPHCDSQPSIKGFDALFSLIPSSIIHSYVQLDVPKIHK